MDMLVRFYSCGVDLCLLMMMFLSIEVVCVSLAELVCCQEFLFDDVVCFFWQVVFFLLFCLGQVDDVQFFDNIDVGVVDGR